MEKMTGPRSFQHKSKIGAHRVKSGLEMTRAIIFVVLISQPHAAAAGTPVFSPVHQAQQTAPQDQTTASAPQQTPPPATKPSAAGSQPNPNQGTARPKSTHPRKKKASPDCSGSVPAATPAATSTPDSSSPSKTDAARSASPNNPCAPKKVIVRQGGISEPSIQLVGPSGGPSSTDRDAVNQTLDSTESNLKQLAGRALTTQQQDTVTQIRQYMDQSKAAISNGELERARTLAWKAHLLSEDLVNPQK